MAKKLTQKEAENKVKELYNGEYKLISKYTKMTEPATLIHIPCGEKIKVGRLKNFTNENKCICRKCHPIKNNHSTKKVTEEEMTNRLKNLLGDEYSYISGYTTMDRKCKFIHNECNNIFESSPKMILGVKQTRCPICSNKNRGKYALKENYLQSILDDSRDGKEYEWLEEYKNNNKIKHKILHKKCNQIYLVRPNDFQQGYRCPHCSMIEQESKMAKYIKELLLEENIEFCREKKFKGCKDKNYLPFDFYLKEFNLIIEFDGQQHFKEQKGIFDFEYTSYHDMIKNNFCNSKKVNIIRIDYKLNEGKILDIIKSIKLGNLEEKIKKYKLYSKYNGKKYNQKIYYTKINKNYFIVALPYRHHKISLIAG